MPNPHGRCKTCKERHAPGNCKAKGGFDITRFAEGHVALWSYANDLANHIEDRVGKVNLHDGAEGRILLDLVKEALKKTAPG